jgi:hypothetical protein
MVRDTGFESVKFLFINNDLKMHLHFPDKFLTNCA